MALPPGRRAAAAAAFLAATSLIGAAAGVAPTHSPTRLDYLALASMADTPQLFALAAYRPTASARVRREPLQRGAGFQRGAVLEKPVRFEEVQSLVL